MNPEKFDPHNPEYKKVEDLPQEHQAEFLNVEGGFVRNTTVEDKEEAHIEALSFSDEVAKETEKVLSERGIDTLSPSDYEKARGGVEREIIRKKLEADSSLNEIHNEAVRKIESAAEEVGGILKEAGVSKGDVDNSRRNFLKYFGLAAATTIAGGMLGKSNKAEAGELTQKAEGIERSMLMYEAEIEANTNTIGVLAMLNDDDIEKINSGTVDEEFSRNVRRDERHTSSAFVGAITGALAGVFTGKRVGGGGYLTQSTGALVGAFVGSKIGPNISDIIGGEKEKPGDKTEIIKNRLKEANFHLKRIPSRAQEGQTEAVKISMADVKNEIIRLNDANKELSLKIMKIRKAFRDL